MKKKIILASILMSQPLFATGSYVLDGCDEDGCMEISRGSTDVFTGIKGPVVLSKKKGKDSKLLLETISRGTGLAMGAVMNIVNGLRNSALDAGFDTFRSELSGPSGRISVDMDLKSGEWSVHVGGSIGASQKYRN